MKKIKNNYNANPLCIRYVEEKPTKKERVIAILAWIFNIIVCPRFSAVLLLLWGFFGAGVMMLCNFPPFDQKITGIWTITKLILVTLIPSVLALRVFIEIEDNL
jgi:hypothetical protein